MPLSFVFASSKYLSVVESLLWPETCEIKIKNACDVGIQCADVNAADTTNSGRGITIKNLFVNANNLATAGINANYNVNIINTSVRYAVDDGIVLENHTYPVLLDGAYSQYNGRHGLYVKNSDTTVYRITNSYFERNTGYGILMYNGFGCIFDNVIVQANTRGGVFVQMLAPTIYLAYCTFIGLYCEANGTLDIADPLYTGNYALIVQGYSYDPTTETDKILGFTFINCALNANPVIGQTVSIKGTYNLTPTNCVGLTLNDVSLSYNALGLTQVDRIEVRDKGTWTVRFYDAASSGNVSSTTGTGYYTRIGNIVTITFNVNDINTTGMTAGNDFWFTLPFKADTTMGINAGSCVLNSVAYPAGTTQINPVADGSLRGLFKASGSATTNVRLKVSNFTSGVSDIVQVGLSYFI